MPTALASAGMIHYIIHACAPSQHIKPRSLFCQTFSTLIDTINNRNHHGGSQHDTGTGCGSRPQGPSSLEHDMVGPKGGSCTLSGAPRVWSKTEQLAHQVKEEEPHAHLCLASPGRLPSLPLQVELDCCRRVGPDV